MASGDSADRLSCLRDELNMEIGSLLGEGHQVVDFLDEGAYGFVTKCYNIESGEMEAVKISKRDSCCLQQIEHEITILREIQNLDPDSCNVIKWNGEFSYKNTICLHFELLDQSLLSLLEKRKQGLLLSDIKAIVFQVATALLHLNSIGIVHADLKPDNIMVVDSSQRPLRVRLIDFGQAFQYNDKPEDTVQVPAYRAPEVFLGLPFSEPIDVWSLGVIAVEMATAACLFPSIDEYDVFNLIVKYHGQPPDHLLDRGAATGNYFSKQSGSEQCWRFKAREEFNKETHADPAEVKSTRLDDLPEVMTDGDLNDRLLFLDLVKKMLQLDPDKRIQPHKILRHPFLIYNSLNSPAVIDIRSNGDTPEVCLQSYQTELPHSESNFSNFSMSSLAAGSEASSGGVQAETSTRSSSYISHLSKWMRDKSLYSFHHTSSEQSSHIQASFKNILCVCGPQTFSDHGSENTAVKTNNILDRLVTGIRKTVHNTISSFSSLCATTEM